MQNTSGYRIDSARMPEGTYIISVDDDVERMTWKVKDSAW